MYDSPNDLCCCVTLVTSDAHEAQTQTEDTLSEEGRGEHV